MQKRGRKKKKKFLSYDDKCQHSREKGRGSSNTDRRSPGAGAVSLLAVSLLSVSGKGSGRLTRPGCSTALLHGAVKAPSASRTHRTGSSLDQAQDLTQRSRPHV